jgi:hypothetical protein
MPLPDADPTLCHFDYAGANRRFHGVFAYSGRSCCARRILVVVAGREAVGGKPLQRGEERRNE